jgi:4,5-DOPA dioxygenase extradiol
MTHDAIQSSRETPSMRMPILFLGHGNPMNAIQDNLFTQKLTQLGQSIPRPQSILCISAHWMTKGTWVTHMTHPKTIHDFFGFPKELFEVEYPASGNPTLAAAIQHAVRKPKIHCDNENWGLDHGTWSVLKHLYPKADIPIVQMSIDMSQPEEYHYHIGEQLRTFRSDGILIIGSGNIVHNLREVDFSAEARPLAWAIEFDEWVKQKLYLRDYHSLMKDAQNSKSGKLSIPTPDHWFPLFYTLGASDKDDSLRFEYEKIDHGSISMRCFSLGLY